jgi:hypothetical protein
VGRLNVLVSDAAAGVADSLQAEYFRGLLADERAVVAEMLMQSRARLARRLAAGELRGISRSRQEIRLKEADLRHLDRMVDALDGRFAGRWTASG